MKGEVDILANFPIDTSLKKKTHSALNRLLINLLSVVKNIDLD